MGRIFETFSVLYGYQLIFRVNQPDCRVHCPVFEIGILPKLLFFKQIIQEPKIKLNYLF